MIDDRDKLHMDSPYFDPEKSLMQILASNNVPQLVNKCNELQIGKCINHIIMIQKRYQKLRPGYPVHGLRELQQIHHFN